MKLNHCYNFPAVDTFSTHGIIVLCIPWQQRPATKENDERICYLLELDGRRDGGVAEDGWNIRLIHFIDVVALGWGAVIAFVICRGDGDGGARAGRNTASFNFFLLSIMRASCHVMAPFVQSIHDQINHAEEQG